MDESVAKSGAAAIVSDDQLGSADRLSEAESEIFGQPLLVEYPLGGQDSMR